MDMNGCVSTSKKVSHDLYGRGVKNKNIYQHLQLGGMAFTYRRWEIDIFLVRFVTKRLRDKLNECYSDNTKLPQTYNVCI